MRILIAAIAAVVSVGCVSTAPPASGSMGEREVAFACDNNESLSDRFIESRDVAILMRGDDKIELKQQRAAAGFVYSNGPNTMRGKGNDLTVEIGRMMPIQCKAI